MEEIIAVVTENSYFEYRDTSKLVAHLKFFGLSGYSDGEFKMEEFTIE